MSDRVQIDDTDFLGAAAGVLKTDADFSAAIALTFRIALMDMFFAGDLYAGTGVVIDPKHPPRPGRLAGGNRAHSARQAVCGVFLRKSLRRTTSRTAPHSTIDSLKADNRLDIIGTSCAPIPTITRRPTAMI